MKKYRIKINGEYFAGVSQEKTYDTPISDNGFYTHRKQAGMFMFGEPYEIDGNWNLRSYLEKIMTSVKNGDIDLKELIVEGGE